MTHKLRRDTYIPSNPHKIVSWHFNDTVLSGQSIKFLQHPWEPFRIVGFKSPNEWLGLVEILTEICNTALLNKKLAIQSAKVIVWPTKEHFLHTFWTKHMICRFQNIALWIVLLETHPGMFWKSLLWKLTLGSLVNKNCTETKAKQVHRHSIPLRIVLTMALFFWT